MSVPPEDSGRHRLNTFHCTPSFTESVSSNEDDFGLSLTSSDTEHGIGLGQIHVGSLDTALSSYALATAATASSPSLPSKTSDSSTGTGRKNRQSITRLGRSLSNWNLSAYKPRKKSDKEPELAWIGGREYVRVHDAPAILPVDLLESDR
jgi:hypothetical protein